jgi:probable rRNA maturation factor
MKVAIQNCPPPFSRLMIRRVLNAAARETKTSHVQSMVDVSFVDDAVIRRVNRKHRGIDRVTDILSFTYEAPAATGPSAGRQPFGELLIGSAQLVRQAKRKKRRLADELRDLLIHGYLHLLGHDHHERVERGVMRGWEDRIRKRLNARKG